MDRKSVQNTKQDHEKAIKTIQGDHKKALKTIREDHEAAAPGGPVFDAYAATVENILDEHEKAIRETPKPKDVFLKLTRKRSDRDAVNDLYIRPESLESISVDIDGNSILNGNRYYTVQESPELIFEMLEVAKDAADHNR